MLPEAYNVDGNAIHPDTVTLMTYNVQMWNGINSQAAMQNAIIAKYKPDLIGMQELANVTTLPTIGQNMLSDYQVKQLSNHKNKIMLVTKDKPLSNLVIADFEHQDPEDATRYNETRAYMKADITINGKTVTLINTHLCYLTPSVMYQQMAEVFALAEQCERVILFGDFNTPAITEQSDGYINMYKQYVDAGYNLANNSPAAGFHNTFTNATSATSLADLTSAPDTIIVSGNIEIVDVVFDTTKFSYLNGSTIDHIPVVARVRL